MTASSDPATSFTGFQELYDNVARRIQRYSEKGPALVTEADITKEREARQVAVGACQLTIETILEKLEKKGDASLQSSLETSRESLVGLTANAQAEDTAIRHDLENIFLTRHLQTLTMMRFGLRDFQENITSFCRLILANATPKSPIKIEVRYPEGKTAPVTQPSSLADIPHEGATNIAAMGLNAESQTVTGFLSKAATDLRRAETGAPTRENLNRDTLLLLDLFSEAGVCLGWKGNNILNKAGGIGTIYHVSAGTLSSFCLG